MSLGEIDVAELTLLGRPLHQQRIGTEAVLIANRQLFTGFLRGFQHQTGVRRGFGHRLLAHDMLAGLQGRHGDLTVGAVGGADMHHVDGFVGQQLMIIHIDLCTFGSVCSRCLLRPFHDQIAERHQFHPVALLLQRGQVLAVGNSAAADNADLQFCHLFFLHFLNLSIWMPAMPENLQFHYIALSIRPQCLSLAVYQTIFRIWSILRPQTGMAGKRITPTAGPHQPRGLLYGVRSRAATLR